MISPTPARRIFYLHYKKALLAEGTPATSVPTSTQGLRSTPQPADHYTYLRLLGILLYLTKSRPDIMAAVSFAGTKSSNPTDRDMSDLYYVVEYLRAIQDVGHILHRSSTNSLRLYCEKPALSKELNFLIAICQELHIPLELPAIIMEDNSAVVTMANNDSGYAKKCKHFLMVLNDVKEQISLGQIEALKIFVKLNNADLHTKPLRSSSFQTMAHRFLGQPPISSPPSHASPTPPVNDIVDPPTEKVPRFGTDVTGQPSSEAKRVHPDPTGDIPGA
eukprot:gene61855-biopygen30420